MRKSSKSIASSRDNATRTEPHEKNSLARNRPVENSAAGNSSLEKIRESAKHCRDCPLWRCATQTVFGAGPKKARLMLIGEQPGDQEDILGKPFVGPAGRLLDRALQDAGIDRKNTYVTNAVKHFKYELRGKRRIHKKPSEKEILACNQWLRRELKAVEPKLAIAMGATAARAVIGRAVKIQDSRGQIVAATDNATKHSVNVLVTVHPSYLLRVPAEDKEAAYRQFVKDLSAACANS